MPVSESAAPSQCRGPIRSWPSAAVMSAMMHRRRREHERAVGDARLRQAGDEGGLVEEVSDDAESRQRQPVAARDLRRACRRCSRAIRPAPTSSGGRQSHRDDDRQEHGRTDRQADGIERLGMQLGERAFDDGVVRAPDDRHQEQERVDAAELERRQEREVRSGESISTPAIGAPERVRRAQGGAASPRPVRHVTRAAAVRGELRGRARLTG